MYVFMYEIGKVTRSGNFYYYYRILKIQLSFLTIYILHAVYGKEIYRMTVEKRSKG